MKKQLTEKQIIAWCIKNMTKQLNNCVKFIHLNKCINFTGQMVYHYSGMHYELFDKILLMFKENVVENENNDYVAKMHNHVISFTYDLCNFNIVFLLD